MAVDYLSAINQRGSGLNVTQIVDALSKLLHHRKIKFNLKLMQEILPFLPLEKLKVHYQNSLHL